jgi:aminoglycoside phosphotransferase (APT) family kinase protein
MKPQIDLAIVLQQASALLGEPLADARAAELGADHLVVFATAPTRGRVVIKVGEDATTDAYVLDQLRDLPVLVSRPLARGSIVADHQSYPTVVMTRVDGADLATIAEQHRYLPELIAQLRLVHRLTTTGVAGTVRDVVQGTAPTSWKAYLRDILTGRNEEFDWERLYRSPLVDDGVLRRAIARLGEELELLPEPPRSHLLHGDLNPANVLVADGRLAGIIDWSYARYGDPLFDFARLRMNPFVRRSPEAVRTYFALLDLGDEERAREEFCFRFNLVEYVNWYVQGRAVDRVREHLALLSEPTSPS